VRVHGIIGKSYPILGWVQMLFGAIVFRGYCRDGALGQCLAHYIMVREVTIRSLLCWRGDWVEKKWSHLRLLFFIVLGHTFRAAVLSHMVSS
jgi:hypothetical protein